MRTSSVKAVLITLAFSAAARTEAQSPRTRREVIRGTVTSATGGPVGGADVIVTRAPDRAFRATTTDSGGRYAIVWEEGTGDYLVHVSAPGRVTFRKRVTRTADEVELIANAALADEVKTQQLGAAVVTAVKPKPDRKPDFGAGVGSAEQIAQSVNGAVTPELIGDLAATVATIPGVMPLSGGGVSVLGLGAAQNSTTLNGMSFAGSDVPRDARVNVRASSTTYDPSRGWFSGAQTNVELAPGGVFGSRRGHLTFDAPALQYGDPVAAAYGGRYSNVRASVGGDGELVADKLYFNYGLQGGTRSGRERSLFDADPSLLSHAGVAADSAARFRQLLQSRGLPTLTAGASSSDARRDLSFLGRLDVAPYDLATLTPARSSLSLTAFARHVEADGVGLGPTAPVGHAGTMGQSAGGLTGDYAFYFGRDYLGDIQSSVSWSQRKSSPYLMLPEVRVRTLSTLADGSTTFANLFGGGSGDDDAITTQWTWETVGKWQLYPPQNWAHRVTMTADARLDGYGASSSGNELGRFTFNSLADFADGVPLAFDRTITSPARNAEVWNAFVSIGDQWRARDALQVAWGVRVEGNRYVGAPALNPDVRATFGARTDYAPSRLHASPRLGFTWTRQGREQRRTRDAAFGQFSGIVNGVFRGGIGEFRNMLSPSLLAAVTGSPLAISCYGASAPTPDWPAYASGQETIPRQCAGPVNSALVDALPSVRLLDRAYDAARSWRANLAWSSNWRGWVYTLEGVASLNLNQPSDVDLNFRNVPRFVLSNENRPMYADADGIVPATGAVSPVGARPSGAFGGVLSQRSDARSMSRQVSLNVAPALPGFEHWFVSAGYVLSSMRAQQRGFDGSTAGSPVALTWARGDLDVRHQVLLQGGYTRTGVTLTLFGRLQSGLPYTPMVGSDVNGDGLANDRAFVFSSLVGAAPPSPGSVSSLVPVTASARACLQRQVNEIAERNSCEGPWTATLNARLAVAGTLLHFGKRVDVALAVANVLGGVDQMLHGANKLRGWGTITRPEPVLSTVRSYDPSAQQFRYATNQRFGMTDPAGTTTRAPFRITLDVSIDIGRSIPAQQIDKWLRPGRGGRPGPRFTMMDFKQRYARNVPDPYRTLLLQSDSLLLSRTQVERMQAAGQRYGARMDSLWLGLSGYLAALPDDYDVGAALVRAEHTIDDAWEITRLDVQATLTDVLDPIQRTMLPFPAKMFFEARGKLTVRMFNATGR